MLFRAICIVLILLFSSALGFAQTAKPDNTLPMYGGIPATGRYQEVDRKFIEEVIRLAGSREKASERAVQLGWQHFYKGEHDMAMKRFNQAWLLVPDNPDAFWGFGIVMGSRGKYDESIKMFERSRALAPQNARMLTDFALSVIAKGGSGSMSQSERNAAFIQAHALLNEAEALEPMFPLIYANRAILFYLYGEYAAAWHSVDRAQGIAPGAVQEKFLRDLSTKMPRPKT